MAFLRYFKFRSTLAAVCIIGIGIAIIGLLIVKHPFIIAAGLPLIIGGCAMAIYRGNSVPGINPKAKNFSTEDDTVETAMLYKAALDAHAYVTMTDVRGTITHANDNFCKLHGFAKEKLIGKNHRFVNSGYHPTVFFEQIFRTLAHGQIWQGEVRNRKKNGEFLWLETTIVPQYDERGAIKHYIAVRTDITKRKMAEECVAESHQQLMKQAEALDLARKEAESANQAKSMYLANISHEIRTPMTAILGFADLLMETASLDVADRGSLAAIQRNGNYLLQLVNDILDLSKIEAGKINIDKGLCNLPVLLAEIIGTTKPKAQEKDITLSLQYTTRIPAMIQTDGLRLRQILLNLIGNAIKFTDKGEVRAKVSAESFDSYSVIKIIICDTGIGITPDKIDSIFKPFIQADISTSRRYGGTGLGLTISRELARLLGGDITATSVPDQGSEFVLSLRVETNDATTMIEPEDLKAESVKDYRVASASLAGRLLVVEDSEDIRLLLKLMLNHTRLSMDMAVNGSEAVQLISERNYDLILMDMHMPVMDGYTAAAKIRARGIQTPIIALTARAMSADREQCLAAGCTDYLPKPIQRDVLISKITQYVAPAAMTQTADDSCLPIDYKVDLAGANEWASSPEYQQLLSNFLSHLNTIAEELQQASDLDDLARIESMAHQLNGAGATFGFDPLSRQAAVAEKVAQAGSSIQTVRSEVSELISLIKRYNDKTATITKNK